MKAVGAVPLAELLGAKKGVIVREWLARTFYTYPEQTSRFLIQERDPFRNPVGSTLKAAFPVLFDAALGDVEIARVRGALDAIVRIRAVQDFTAGQAVAFIFLLKRVIRDALRDNGRTATDSEALPALEDRIDQMALLAFDLYMQCRERIFEIRVSDARRRIGLLLKRRAVEGRTEERYNP